MMLLAADFAKGAVDVFDSVFHQVKLASWQFRPPGCPGYVPSNTDLGRDPYRSRPKCFCDVRSEEVIRPDHGPPHMRDR